ncbi:MAG: hypothetical protein LBD17_00835, partial [Endomicrobium sp.]|nr:hypothetical protein [Endomicrobium sp.]
ELNEAKLKFHKEKVKENSQIRFEYTCTYCGKLTTQALGSIFKHDDLLCNACRRLKRNKKLKKRRSTTIPKGSTPK